MKTKSSAQQLEAQIQAIQRKLRSLGLMHPGSLSLQFQICGRPGCRCGHKTHPKPHGPYSKLSYVYQGKPTCKFIRADCVAKMKKRLSTYKNFRQLTDQWIHLSIQLAQMEFF